MEQPPHHPSYELAEEEGGDYLEQAEADVLQEWSEAGPVAHAERRVRVLEYERQYGYENDCLQFQVHRFLSITWATDPSIRIIPSFGEPRCRWNTPI